MSTETFFHLAFLEEMGNEPRRIWYLLLGEKVQWVCVGLYIMFSILIQLSI